MCPFCLPLSMALVHCLMCLPRTGHRPHTSYRALGAMVPPCQRQAKLFGAEGTGALSEVLLRHHFAVLR